MARLVLIGLNYSQPFLISRLITYVGGQNPDKNDGYGLIGAFALVFVLKAVCYLFLISFSAPYDYHTVLMRFLLGF